MHGRASLLLHKTRCVTTGWSCCTPAPARPAGLDTGDLVLFDRPCLKMGGFFGAAVCAAAKVMGGSPFDHIGVVVRKTEEARRRKRKPGGGKYGRGGRGARYFVLRAGAILALYRADWVPSCCCPSETSGLKCFGGYWLASCFHPRLLFLGVHTYIRAPCFSLRAAKNSTCLMPRVCFRRG